MWIIVVLIMFGSLIGFTQLSTPTDFQHVSDEARVTTLAENLASYRTGVINYAKANPNFPTPGQPCQAPVTTFPTGYVALNPQPWTNCILVDGTIVVYASTKLDVDIFNAISKLAKRSVLVGRANTTAPPTVAALIDLLFNGTDLPTFVPALPSSAHPLIDGVPVWLAHRN